jgi:iron complex outermembrane receptor protein
MSPTETLSPVDVFGGDSVTQQATFDLTDGLTKLSPALNTQRFPIADGTAFIRPVSLRNLSPDQTLVLVNGSRRHRSPLVNLQLAPLGYG